MSEDTAILRDILSTLREIRDSLRSGGGAGASAPSGKSGADVASDSDLDGPHGNPAVRKDPSRWTGPSYVGCAFSECPPDYLDSLAGLFDWMAGKDEESTEEKKRKSARYKRLDAKRARGWAQRLRNGWQAPAQEESSGLDATNDYGGAGAIDDIPFASCDAAHVGERWWRWDR